MENISQKLSLLKNARYLQASLESTNINSLELLSLGRSLRAQIEKHWQLSQAYTATQLEEPKLMEIVKNQTNVENTDPRLQFIHTIPFRDNLKLLKPSNNEFSNFQPHKMKLVGQNSKYINIDPFKYKEADIINGTQLVTDHFFHETCGLAKLYKIQRERKIWWMRFSSDPSRYYLEPYQFSQNSQVVPNAQSITIKSRLGFGDLGVEHITLANLADVKLEHNKDFEVLNERTNKKQLPVVIRSVIELDVATCALIFDGLSNKKRAEALFLNRRLAPFQCQIMIESNDNDLSEMKALSRHLSYVMKRSGLRVFKNDDEKIEHKYDLETKYADQIGIPYTILLNSDSLKRGLLKLRNRDTTLKETIHISDIPNYLLSIFQAT